MSKKFTIITARVESDLMTQFNRRADLHGLNRSEMLRYLMVAFVEGRLTVRQPAAVKSANKELHK